ncbi:MAG: hypothetical protein CMB48_07170 [Euryarchaeota archaeon]|nr:hypothetical protein [Euryarchaeota archaeon]
MNYLKLKHELNRSQRLGLDIDKHVAISAGAGTGKTTVMALRYIEHLLNIEQRATVLLPRSPRRPLQGPGSLRMPKREQIDLKEWGGLLPSECVAITFTNDAADELRHRIRTLLFEKQQDDDDPRINKEGLIEQMLSLLDDAPIGTIDSFFSSLLQPWMGLVNEDPTNQNVGDETRQLLTNLAIKTAWRIRNDNDAFEAGINTNQTKFIDSRNRLSLGLGGQFTAEKVLGELLSQSLFVEESELKINKLCSGGINKSDAIQNYIQNMILDISRSGLNKLDEVYNLGFNWLNGCTKFASDLDIANALQINSRYAALDDLIRSGLPEDDWEKLQWFSHFEYIITSENAFLKMDSKSSAMPYGMLPNSDKKWPSGINPRSAIKGTKNKERSKIEIKGVGEEISKLLGTPIFAQLRRMSYCAWLFNPIVGCPKHPEGSLRGAEIISQNFGVTPPENKLIASIPLQISLLDDLFNVQHGIQAILHKIKITRGMHDYSDIQRLAEDLLLARCPDVCRFLYPKKVIQALDSLSENPWEDLHIENALFLSSGNKKVLEDLSHRFEVVKLLRRRFRTFIIDEYQDTNPQQYRLLCRLFGKRKLEPGESPLPTSSWDPTICVVGDLKQSIFRFRQAQVTVMLKTISIIREINQIEMIGEKRLIELRKRQGVTEGFGRDPRPILSKSKTNKFVTGDILENKFKGSNENVLDYSLGDNDEILNHETQLERQQGHLKLSMNYRTDGGILLTFNEIFKDLFSEKNDYISGDWHARAQSLKPSSDLKNKSGKLEWILPTLIETENEEINDLSRPLNPFNNTLSKSYEKEHELLSARLFALIHGIDCRILGNNPEKIEWMKIPAQEKISPEEIMILVQKRTHISDLMSRLSNWGIPAVVDRKKGLLEQPIVRTLYDLLNSVVNPNDKTIMSSLLRSELVCFNDKQLHTFIKKIDKNKNLFELLLEFVEESPQKQMYARWNALCRTKDFVTLLEETLDFSDLLSIYSSSEDRQLAEQFISTVSVILSQVSGSGKLLMSNLEKLKQEGVDIPAKTLPLSGAIRVMTIHAAKGLQSKVVVLCGLFDDLHYSLNNITSKKLVVTPELMASQLKPWSSRDGVESGMWQLSKLLTKSQIQAETRRLLYVALTRVEKHLILVGGKNKSPPKMVNSNIINMSFKKQENPSLGEMIFSGIACNSIKNDNNPWLIPSEKSNLNLQPKELFHNSYFDTGLNSITIFHSLDCFPVNFEEGTPFYKILQEQKLLESNNLETEEINFSNKRELSLKLAPHKLDLAGRIVNSSCTEKCKKRQWSNANLGFDLHSLLAFCNKKELLKQGGFPSPADFGTIFHRLVEVGIGNPAKEENYDLPLTWKRNQKSKLLDKNIISEIINELLPSSADKNITEKRLEVLSKLFEEGPLGELCSGKILQGLKIDGLLTEMPFECTIPINLDQTGIQLWTPYGIKRTAEIEGATISFSGRIDLVLALSDELNNKFLMAVDIKTEGSLHGFNENDEFNGTLLQFPNEDKENRFNLSDSEKELLTNHSFQLALYNNVLNLIQGTLNEGRTVLPPCIYVAASGRLISWDDSEQKIMQGNLNKLLIWIINSSINNEKINQNWKSISEDQESCENCSYDSENFNAQTKYAK